jgi:hypothetical protein
MPLALPDPYIGGDFAEDLTDVSDEEFRKKMKERFDSLQRNLDKLAKQFPLTAVSNLPQTPQARVTNTTGQSFGTGASTVPFNSTRWDLGTATAQFDDANNRLVCREAGLYVVYGHLAVDGTTFQLSLRVNGTTTIARSDGSYAGWFEGTVSTLYRLDIDDYVELRLNNQSGGTRTQATTANSEDVCELAWTWISP